MQRAIGIPSTYRPTRPIVRPHPALARTLRRAHQLGIIAVSILLYFLVRGLVDGRETEAVRHADSLIDFERALGIFWEPRLQEWALRIGPLDTVANWIYIWGHWPVIAATLTWLLIAHRDSYSIYRNALLLSGAVGLVVFIAFPMAPPRLVDTLGVVDTITLHSPAYRVLQPPSLVNQYAAMPSLHCGWDLLMGIAIVRHARGRLRMIGYVLPVAMYLATILTANHYVMDGLIGMALVVVALWVVTSIRRSSPLRPALSWSLAPRS